MGYPNMTQNQYMDRKKPEKHEKSNIRSVLQKTVQNMANRRYSTLVNT